MHRVFATPPGEEWGFEIKGPGPCTEAYADGEILFPQVYTSRDHQQNPVSRYSLLRLAPDALPYSCVWDAQVVLCGQTTELATGQTSWSFSGEIIDEHTLQAVGQWDGITEGYAETWPYQLELVGDEWQVAQHPKMEGRDYPPVIRDAIEDRRQRLAGWLAREGARRTEGLLPGTCARRIEAVGGPGQVQYQSA